MRCNLIISSRKCPECKNDAYNLHIGKGSALSPIFHFQADHIRRKVDEHYGVGCGIELIPDERTAFLEACSGYKNILINGGPVGRLYPDGDVSLNASGLGVISGRINGKKVTCDHDSSYFVTKGRNIMVTGISGIDGGLSKGDIVAVLDYKGIPIAEGIMKMSSGDIATADRGVAVNIRNNDCPRLNDGKRYNDWKQTLEVNGPTMESIIGEAVRNIRIMGDSYKYPFAVRLSSDVFSEANLMLVLAAGYRPSLIISDSNDFTDYMSGKLGLDVIDDIPEKCILISDRNEDQTLDVIPHNPTDDWDQSMVWMYIMMRSEPFDPAYMREI